MACQHIAGLAKATATPIAIALSIHTVLGYDTTVARGQAAGDEPDTAKGDQEEEGKRTRSIIMFCSEKYANAV